MTVRTYDVLVQAPGGGDGRLLFGGGSRRAAELSARVHHVDGRQARRARVGSRQGWLVQPSTSFQTS